MAESILVDIASAVIDEIQGHDFGLEFESELSYADASRELKDLTGKLHIDVVPFRAPIIGLADRSNLLYEATVDIVIRKKFTKDDHPIDAGEVDPAEVNRLVKLVQDVEELFTPSQAAGQTGGLTSFTDAKWKETDKKMDYSRPHLYSKSQFTGWVRVTYDAVKEPG